MTPDVFIDSEFIVNSDYPVVLALAAYDSTTVLRVHVTPDTFDAVATATCGFLARLLATCEQHDLRIIGGGNTVSNPLSGAALFLFFQESRDDLQKVVVCDMVLSEDQCRALTTMSRLDVEVTISNCNLADDAAGAFVDFLQSDRGPVDLYRSEIGSQILANALTGDSRVTRFKPAYGWADDADRAIMFRALANNRGLVDLDLCRHSISNENWAILCESLQAHPTLTSLNLIDTRPRRHTGPVIILSDEQKTLRTRLLTDMVQRNTVLHTIVQLTSERNNQIYTEEIRPSLVTNQYRPRVHAIKKTKDRPFREKVLGRTVYNVKSNPNLVWMLLSENVDAFVRSFGGE
jgi:hypothetical protein